MSEFIISNRIKIYYLYIDNNELNLIKSEDLLLKNDIVIEKESLFKLIQKNKIINDRRYSLKTILKFNIDVKNLPDYRDILDDNNFLKNENYIRDIYFENVSCIFENINSLFILYDRKTTNKKINFTKKISHKPKNKSKKIFNTKIETNLKSFKT